jgi:hypothetical protein
MPCNASYARFIFGKFFTSTIILYVLLFAQNFYSCKKWVLHRVPMSSAEVVETELTAVEVATSSTSVDFSSCASSFSSSESLRMMTLPSPARPQEIVVELAEEALGKLKVTSGIMDGFFLIRR